MFEVCVYVVFGGLVVVCGYCGLWFISLIGFVYGMVWFCCVFVCVAGCIVVVSECGGFLVD